MANALQWIINEAKHLRRKDHSRREWKHYVAQASAIYARKHKGRSPVGKKRKPAKRRRVGTIGKGKPGRAAPASTPVFYVRRGQRFKGGRGGVNGVRTTSRSHVDKNRITANIQIGKVPAGSLAAELKRRIKQKIDRAVIRKYHASTKRDKRRHQKEITTAKRELKKLS